MLAAECSVMAAAAILPTPTGSRHVPVPPGISTDPGLAAIADPAARTRTGRGWGESAERCDATLALDVALRGADATRPAREGRSQRSP